jgi:uncharacterized protein YbdZ (MbtH family)
MTIEPIELSYELHLLPRGRLNFRRWRYELWHGQRLLVAGWRLSAVHAQRALRQHAVHYAHRRYGLHPLRPDDGPSGDAMWHGRAVEIEWGDLRIVLTPRAVAPAAVAHHHSPIATTSTDTVSASVADSV